MTGRPRFYNEPEEMEGAIEDYFLNEDKPTITGLCLHLGFESRQAFYAHEKIERFSYTIRRARMRLESVYERHLQREQGQVAGPIFALKNLGWKDKVETEITSTNRIVIADDGQASLKDADI